MTKRFLHLNNIIKCFGFLPSLLIVLGVMGCCSLTSYENILGEHDLISIFSQAKNKADVLAVFKTHLGCDAESLDFQNACMEDTDRLLIVKFGRDEKDPIPLATLQFIFDSSGELTTIGRTFINEQGEVISVTELYLPKYRKDYRNCSSGLRNKGVEADTRKILGSVPNGTNLSPKPRR